LLAVANTQLTEAQAPEQRLSAVVHELEAAERDLTTCRAADDRVLGAWLADGAEAERPEPSVRTCAAERTVAALDRNVIAARTTLPEHQAKVQICAERVRDLSIARGDAAYRAAVEVVREFLDREFRPAIQRVLAIEAKARSVEHALREFGNGAKPSPVALGCSVEVAAAIRGAKAAAAIAHDHEVGKQLIERLMSDADATLNYETVGPSAVTSVKERAT
jgi:hypothetical protein